MLLILEILLHLNIRMEEQSRFDPKGIVYQSVCATCGSGSFPSNNALFPGNPAGDVCNLGVLKFEFDFQGVEASATVPANITLCSTDYTVISLPAGAPLNKNGFLEMVVLQQQQTLLIPILIQGHT